MSQFECGGKTYKAGVIDARAQFHIVRRLAPVLASLAPEASKVAAAKKAGEKISAEGMLAMVPVMAGALSGLSDEDADYVLFGLLSVVSRQEEKGLGWAPVKTAGQDALQYSDITMPQMLTLAVRALMANLGDFFDVLNSALSLLPQKQKEQ